MQKYKQIKQSHLLANKMDRIIKSEWRYGVLGEEENAASTPSHGGHKVSKSNGNIRFRQKSKFDDINIIFISRNGRHWRS
jgi:hypothetical protein